MMIHAAGARYTRLPMLPEDWRRHAPELCEGVEADYLLIDLGPSDDHPRFTIMGLTTGAYTLHLVEAMEAVHAPLCEGGLGVSASLFVPLYREEPHHRGHIAALYRDVRRFDDQDIGRLHRVALRFVTFLGGR